ncbi:MAG: EAL domain-containing protein [Candidatus Magnetomorum sp.]|nr:EAL domain-containing protein [Candidatus Magnetomorum sp.]
MKNSKRFVLFVFLTVLGLIGNIYNIEMFFGVNQVFGSIFVLIAVYFFGQQLGVLCAILVHAYTIFLWGHPYAFLSFVFEAWFVGLLLKKRTQNLFIADILYWLFIGVPLAYLFYGFTMKMPYVQVMTIMLKQPANAFFNALLATIIVHYFPVGQFFGEKQKIKFNHLLLLLIMGFTLISLFITANFTASYIFDKRLANIQKEVTCFSKHMSHKISMFKTNAQLTMSLYNQLYQTNNKWIQLPINSPFTMIYSWEPSEKQVKVIAYKNNPVHQFPVHLLSPELSHDIQFFPNNPSEFFISSQNNDQFFIGVQAMENLETLVNVQPNQGGYQNFIVQDMTLEKENKLQKGVYQNRSLHLNGYKPFFHNDLCVLLPDNQALSKLLKWEKSFMVKELSCIGKGFHLAITKSLKSMMDDLQHLYIYIFSLMLMLIIIALIVSGWISSQLESSIQALSDETSNLPDKLLDHQHLIWPNSSINEINTLIHNIKRVAATLQFIFQESENRYNHLFSNTTDALFVVEPNTFEIIDVNMQAESLTGTLKKELRHRSIDAFIEGFHFEQSNINASLEDFRCYVFNQTTRIPVLIRMHPMRYRQNDVYIFVVKNIQDSVKMQEYLQLSAKVFETTHEGIMITDAKKKIIMVNKSFEQITGYSSEEIIGKDPAVMASGWHDRTFYQNMWKSIYQEGMWQGEINDRRKNGEMFSQVLSIFAIKDQNGKLTNYIGICLDITEKVEDQKRIQKLANYDTLTNLPNRTSLMTRLTNAISVAHQNALQLGLIVIDMDNFNAINDSYGHKTGDILLKKIVEKILPETKNIGTMGRMGADTFAIIFEKLSQTEDLAYFSQNLLSMFEKPLMIDTEEVYTSASMGICFYPDDAETAEEMVQHADIAMHRAKEFGKKRFEFYTHAQNVSAREKIFIENGLRKAIQNNQLEVYYQPQIDIHEGNLIGCEALSRWIHPEKGFIPPDIFIPVAEESGLVGDIERWMLTTAARQIKVWRDRGFELMMSVNISNYQFRKKEFIETIQRIIDTEQAKYEWFELELTERIVMDHKDVIEKLDILKKMGFRLSLDDFGTGYSSLAYLKKFNIDKLKIDKSFIQDLPDDSQSRDIAKAIISLADSLNMAAIAEGVETQGQLDFLAELSCEAYQGYFFSKPVPVDAFEKFLQ